MRKILFFIILLPAIFALGHDIYVFSQNPEKGLRFSDTGVLWDKYHKKSHDKWKIKINEFSKSVSDLDILKQKLDNSEKNINQDVNDNNYYSKGFTLVKKKNGEVIELPLEEKNIISEGSSKIQKIAGFILEQKAVLVFLCFALIIYIINSILTFIFKGKSSEDKITRLKNKKGGYKYNRK